MADDEAEAAAEPAHVPPGQWTLHLDTLAPCDGTDDHLLSASLRKRTILAAIATAVLALVISTGQFLHFGVYAVTLCVIFWITAGYSLSVQVDTVVLRRFGFTRRIPLSEVAEVERYQYRNATSLRLLNRSGKRVVSVSARVLNKNPVAAGHLRHWLDRTDVAWGPGAWALLAPSGVISPLTATRSLEPGPTGTSSGPRGAAVGTRPQSRWIRGVAIFSWVVVLLGAALMVVLVPIVWDDYSLSQRIQNGPEALDSNPRPQPCESVLGGFGHLGIPGKSQFRRHLRLPLVRADIPCLPLVRARSAHAGTAISDVSSG